MKKILLIIFFGFLAGTAFVFFLNRNTSVEAVKEPVEVATTPTPEPEVATTEIHSADGDMKLFMKKTGAVPATFEFYVSDQNSEKRLIFQDSLTDSYFSVPANSWSPDNKYFFIKQNFATRSAYLVFKANGDQFLDGTNFVEVSDIFNKKVTKYELRDVTGWDAPGLMHVFTSGPAFWFDLGNRAFLQLATR